MKKTLLCLIQLFVFSYTNAQPLEWFASFGGQETEMGTDAYIDAAGNMYITGTYAGTADFDPGPGVFNLVSASSNPSAYDGFITKLDPNGNFLWAKSVGGQFYDYINSVAVDDSGNVYLGGYYTSSVDFDPGPGTHITVSNGTDDFYILKLSSAGNFVWVKSFGSTSSDRLYKLTLDSYYNVCATGRYTNTVDFDPGPGVHNMNGGQTFILKLDRNGNFVWSANTSGSYSDDMVADAQDNLYVTSNGSNTDTYVNKVDVNGASVWTGIIGGTGNQEIWDLRIDQAGDIIVVGRYDGGTVTFNGSPTNLVINGTGYDAFILKLDPTGNLVWSKPIHGDYLTFSSVAFDNSDNIYLTGVFEGGCDFDPGPAAYTLYATPNPFTAQYNDIFVEKLSSSGAFIWASQFKGPSSESPSNILIRNDTDIYVFGYYQDTVDFDMSQGTFLIPTAGSTDVFLCRISQDLCTYVGFALDSVSDISCTGPGGAEAVASNSHPPYSFTWNTSPAVTSPAVIFTDPGIYEVQFADSMGCQRSISVLITAPVSTAGHELSAHIDIGSRRVGFNSYLRPNAFNNDCNPVNGQLSLVFDPAVFLYDHAYPAPDQVSGDTLIWDLPGFNSDSGTFSPIVFGQISPAAAIGSTLHAYTKITPFQGDADVSNNQRHYYYTLTGPYDPNIIEVHPGECEEAYVTNDQVLTYTVHFQNTGNDTAVNIFVLDSLDTDLDLNTVRVTGSSHAMHTEVLPGNVLKFVFNGIFLPDSNTNEIGSHAYFIYEVMQHTGLTNGTSVENRVGIYFDYNLPVYTNTVVNTVVDTIPVCAPVVGLQFLPRNSGDLTIFPNPSSGLFSVKADLTGSYTVTDIIGRSVITGRIENKKAMLLDLSAVPAGIYFLRTAQGTFKLIKE